MAGTVAAVLTAAFTDQLRVDGLRVTTDTLLKAWFVLAVAGIAAYCALEGTEVVAGHYRSARYREARFYALVYGFALVFCGVLEYVCVEILLGRR